MSFCVFIPSHITGFFTIMDNDNILKKGSCGMGFLLSKGVRTSIKSTLKDETLIKINGKIDKTKQPIVYEVLKLLHIDYPVKISQEIEVPVGCGFGTSAGQALGVAIGLCNDDITKAGQIAHTAEVNLGAGLGDVIAQTGKGLVLRVKPGAPGIGEIKSFNQEDMYVGCKFFGEIATSSIIQDETYKKIISKAGSEALISFKSDQTVQNFLDLSYRFSKETNLISDELLEVTSELNSNEDILGSSMAMLGQTVFAFSKDKSAFPSDFTVYELDNNGIKYD